MKRTYCDRCGAELTYPLDVEEIGYPNYMVIGRREPSVLGSDIDLCVPCRKALAEWMRPEGQLKGGKDG